MGRVTHFEVHAAEPERAIAFYEKVLGWTFHKWEGPMPYWLINTGPDDKPGIHGGLVQRRGEIDGTAVIAFVCIADVEDVDASVAAALKSGGELALAKMAVPSIGWLAYCKDTEGNIFGMMQADAAAA